MKVKGAPTIATAWSVSLLKSCAIANGIRWLNGWEASSPAFKVQFTLFAIVREHIRKYKSSELSMNFPIRFNLERYCSAAALRVPKNTSSLHMCMPNNFAFHYRLHKIRYTLRMCIKSRKISILFVSLDCVAIDMIFYISRCLTHSTASRKYSNVVERVKKGIIVVEGRNWNPILVCVLVLVLVIVCVLSSSS